MVLQTLFALYSMFPAGPAVDPSADPVPRIPRTVHATITIEGSRVFTAEVFAPNPALFESRYPGAVIVATEETRDRAFLLGQRMSEIGVTVIMYTQEPNATHRLHVFDAKSAVDSMRRRVDVRPEEVGVIAFDVATRIVPELVRDSTLNFAIAATSKESIRDLTGRYTSARAATLLVQGIENLDHRGIPLTNSVTQGATVPPMYIAPPLLKPRDLPKEEAQRIQQLKIAPNVVVWPVSQEQLEGIGDAHSLLGNRVVGWVREQVHARPGMSLQTDYTMGYPGYPYP